MGWDRLVGRSQVRVAYPAPLSAPQHAQGGEVRRQKLRMKNVWKRKKAEKWEWHSQRGPRGSSAHLSMHKEAKWGNYVFASECPESNTSPSRYLVLPFEDILLPISYVYHQYNTIISILVLFFPNLCAMGSMRWGPPSCQSVNQSQSASAEGTKDNVRRVF